MFIGCVGLISFLYSLSGRVHKRPYHYPKERVIIWLRMVTFCKKELPLVNAINKDWRGCDNISHTLLLSFHYFPLCFLTSSGGLLWITWLNSFEYSSRIFVSFLGFFLFSKLVLFFFAIVWPSYSIIDYYVFYNVHLKWEYYSEIDKGIKGKKAYLPV